MAELVVVVVVGVVVDGRGNEYLATTNDCCPHENKGAAAPGAVSSNWRAWLRSGVSGYWRQGPQCAKEERGEERGARVRRLTARLSMTWKGDTLDMNGYSNENGTRGLDCTALRCIALQSIATTLPRCEYHLATNSSSIQSFIVGIIGS